MIPAACPFVETGFFLPLLEQADSQRVLSHNLALFSGKTRFLGALAPLRAGPHQTVMGVEKPDSDSKQVL
jgi:hypothetical protein